ncbi:uncharacterized protein LOC130783765 isoform X2 [Actinidia eriantha]|uniref:uncharacterized protein LOC130783765 isoform X2 n=1 Tax=Actinidia eriantha TaxID=165200 RepID=UPI002583A108|nr:uncharacterized protein LOC130783765 isoform X2 [Actinidia eriantha]
MSARSLRKVLKEQEAQGKQSSTHQVDNGGDESESPDSSTHPFLNPFDLLNDDDADHDQGSEVEIPDELVMRNIDDKEPYLVKATVNAVPSSIHKAKKKKKNKNKEDPSSYTQYIDKPLDDKLKNLSVDDSSSSLQSGSLKANPANVEVGDSLLKQCMVSILQVDPKFLSAENELRKIFGSKVVDSFHKNHQTSSSRQIRGGRRGSHNHRRTILVSPSEHWPRWDGSLSMELLETRDGYHYFKYVHSSSYSQAQKAFEASKAIHDLNGIASILLYHPYHLDSLIAMAEYFKFAGEHQMSADAIAKCLYALECAWHPMFSPLQGNCQLKYNSHESNRPLFSTLFAHMKNMDRRGCHRSALEICKLLLSLDSDDPMGAMFCIDYFSLRAEEYAWLERFSEEYRRDNSIWLFPNFSYSLANCRLYLELEGSSKDTQMESGKATSTDLLKQALMLHPSVLKKLVAKVPLKDQAWTKILEHSLFRSDQTGSPSLDHLINIYVERSYVIWRLPDLQKLLKNSALLVIETLEHSGSDARDWACVRKEAFSSEKNEYCHLLVSDFSDSMPTMPPDNLQNFLAEPRMREIQNGDQVANVPNGVGVPHNLANRNPFVVLLESMLPWIDYGSRDGIGEDDQHNGHVEDAEN